MRGVRKAGVPGRVRPAGADRGRVGDARAAGDRPDAGAGGGGAGRPPARCGVRRGARHRRRGRVPRRRGRGGEHAGGLEDGRGPLTSALWGRALLVAVDEWWVALADAYHKARPALVRGDVEGAAEILDGERPSSARSSSASTSSPTASPVSHRRSTMPPAPPWPPRSGSPSHRPPRSQPLTLAGTRPRARASGIRPAHSTLRRRRRSPGAPRRPTPLPPTTAAGGLPGERPRRERVRTRPPEPGSRRGRRQPRRRGWRRRRSRRRRGPRRSAA